MAGNESIFIFTEIKKYVNMLNILVESRVSYLTCVVCTLYSMEYDECHQVAQCLQRIRRENTGAKIQNKSCGSWSKFKFTETEFFLNILLNCDKTQKLF